MKKKILIVGLFIIIIICVIVNIYILSHNGHDKDSGDDVLKDIVYSGMKITNANITSNDDLSFYKSVLTNVSDDTIAIDKLYIIFYENEKKMKLLALSNTELSPNENTIIDIVSEDNLKNITNIEFLLENKE